MLPTSTVPLAPSDLRLWQAECLDTLLARVPEKNHFLVTATPGAGKTTLGLRFGAALASRGLIDQIRVVAPTCEIVKQWQTGAGRVRLNAVAMTYAGVDGDPAVQAAAVARARTLVTFDECHHSGDSASWGQSMQAAFGDAAFILNLSGTPFREDMTRIPFVEYGSTGSSVADFEYSYSRAIEEGVCRPVEFEPVNCAILFRGTPTDDESAAVLRSSLDPRKGVIEAMVRAADGELTVKRRTWPDAGGLLVAMTQAHARACAAVLERVTGQRPAIVVSDSDSAGADLAAFRAGTARWIVAVKMVSEGVDIPRLMVAVYATNISSTLFFRQLVGRVVRIRQAGAEETASVFFPRDDRLIREALKIEGEVRTALASQSGCFAGVAGRLAGGTRLLTSDETLRPKAPVAPSHNWKYTETYRRV
jgi:superfamily II DNA or RNA helicase